VLVFVVLLCLCSSGAFPIGIWSMLAFGSPGLQVWRSPVFDLFLLIALLAGGIGLRTGVFVGDAGVMVRTGLRGTVIPWREIAYAEVAEVPKFPVIWQRGPTRGLILVAPSGDRRSLPARVAAFSVNWGRGGKPYIELDEVQMTQVVNRINEGAAGQRPQPWSHPGNWPFPPR
jgi:hypothetical protein